MFGVENQAYQVDKNQFHQLPDCFLCVINRSNDLPSIAMIEKKANSVKVQYENGQKEKLDIDYFKAQWSGVTVLVEPSERKETSFKANTFSITTAFVGLASLYTVLSNFNWMVLLSLLLVMVGFGISLLIVQESLGIRNALTARVCNSGKNSSCNEVLSSKGAKIFGFIELADASIIYFVTLWLTIFLSSLKGSSFAEFYLFVVSSIIILPYTIYYQWRVVKKWCLLCLGITIVILCLSILGGVYLSSNNFSFGLGNAMIPVGSLVFVSLVWIEIKKLWKQHIHFKKLEFDHYKFKRDSGIFDAALKKSVPLTEPNYIPIVIGNKTSEEKITIVLSTSCGYCHDTYTNVQGLLKKNESLKIEILFNMNIGNIGNRYNVVAKRLMEIAFEDSKIDEALSDWFEKNTSLNVWLEKWKESKNKKYDSLLHEHVNWCTKNNINYTPAIVYKNYLFPEAYSLTDLYYVLK